jgi:hypothetical protein
MENWLLTGRHRLKLIGAVREREGWLPVWGVRVAIRVRPAQITFMRSFTLTDAVVKVK